MSNGMSGTTNYIHNYAQDHKDNAMASRRAAFTNYVNSYIEQTSKKLCKCSACKTENSIHPVKFVKTAQGIEETWKCDHCGRVVPRFISKEELSYRANVDRLGN